MSYATDESFKIYPAGYPIGYEQAVRLAGSNTRINTEVDNNIHTLNKPIKFLYRCYGGDLLELCVKYYTHQIVIMDYTHCGSTYGTVCDSHHMLYGPNGEVWKAKDYQPGAERSKAFLKFMEQFNEKPVILQDEDDDMIV